MMTYFNPYYDKTLPEFFWQLLVRLWGFASGHLSLGEVASDEIQMLVLIGVAGSAGLVGTFLILRRMAMLANSISHTILIGIVIAFVAMHKGYLSSGSHDHEQAINIEIMLFASVVMGIVTSLLTEFFTKTVRLQEDASTGLVFTSLFALGVVMVTILTRNAHIGAEVVMGNVDALHIDDCILVYLILIANIVVFTLLFKEYKITTFDPGLAKALGFSATFFNYLLMVQVSASIVGAFRAVGVIMVLAFITGPPLTARLLTNDLKKMLIISMGLGCAASIIGVAFARHILTVSGIALSTAGVVVCTIAAMYVAVLLVTQISLHLHKRKQRALHETP